MPLRDRTGRRYAMLKAVKLGDRLQADNQFTCLDPGQVCEVYNADGLCIECKEGNHLLIGQLGLFGELIGMYKVD